MKLFILLLCTLPCFAGYNGYRSFTVDHTKVGASDSTNFTVLVSGTWSEFATVANGGKVANTVSCGVNSITCPADLVFTSDAACTTALSWEIETYTASTGALIAWVKVGTLSHSVDTLIYGCVGNAAVAAFQGGSTGAAWDSHYKGVWHVPDGTTLSAKDSTVNGINGTLVNTPTATSGQIDGAGSFVFASPQYITVPDQGIASSANRTIEGWFFLTASAASFPAIFGEDNGHGTLAVNPSYYLVYQWEITSDEYQSTALPLSAGQWYYGALVVTPTAATVYLNNSSHTNTKTHNTYPSTTAEIGRDRTNTHSWNGTLDEIRISDNSRSADWITASYNNQASPSTFYTVSAFTPLAVSGSKMLLLGAQ